MESSAYLKQILEIPILQALPEELRESVAKVFLETSLETVLVEGEVLYSKGAEDANTGALLVSGSVRVDGGGDSTITVGAPELLGEMQQYDSAGQRAATVTATEESVVLEFAWHDFIVLAMDTLNKGEQVKLREAISEHVGIRLKELSDLAGPAQDDA